jgi:DNA mismatch repair protein MutS
MDNQQTEAFSLLYPLGRPGQAVYGRWGQNAVKDLGIDEIAMAISIGSKYIDPNRRILLELCGDAEVIGYRQQVLDDILHCAGLVEGLEELLPSLAKLRDYALTYSQSAPIQQTLGRLSELNTFVNCVREMQALLDSVKPAIQSRGLRELRKLLAAVEADETFQSLSKNLPELLGRLNSVPSITIGINLDYELRPVEATLLTVNDKPFTGGSLLDRLMGRRKGRKENQGIGQLHELAYERVEAFGRSVAQAKRVDPMLVPLFKDLYEILKAVIQPINAALAEYARFNVRFLIPLENEIAFYLGAAALVRRLQAHGLPVCCPEILPAAERICQMQGMFNLLLALRLEFEKGEARLGEFIVLNDVDFGPHGRIFILTGPNQGGKTVYAQAVGVAQILFQAGLHIPAGTGRLSPLTGIYTHFMSAEKADPDTGRLAEEAQQMGEIFQSVDDQSLVLLNESLSSTSPGESLYLARDVVRALRLYGVLAIYATHLHELAENVEAVNAEVPGDSSLVSLVAGITVKGDRLEASEDVTRTYKIKPSPPRGLSYAKGIAARYGISYKQLAARRQERDQKRSDR